MKSILIREQRPPTAPVEKMGIKCVEGKMVRSSSILVRGMDTITGRRAGLSRRGSNNSSLTEESLSDKKMVRFNTKKNKVHNVATRKQLEPIRSEVWYTKQELRLMNEAASAAVYYSDSIQKYADTCASFHQSLALHKADKSSKPVMQAPRIIQEGLNYGYRGLEQHCKAADQRHALVSETVKKIVRTHRKKPATESDENQLALAKCSMKLSRPNKEWALVLAELDLAAMSEDFDIRENMDLPESLDEDADESTLLYL